MLNIMCIYNNENTKYGWCNNVSSDFTVKIIDLILLIFIILDSLVGGVFYFMSIKAKPANQNSTNAISGGRRRR